MTRLLGTAVFLLSFAAAQAPPKDGPTWFNEGLAQHTRGAYDDAIASFQHALDLKFNVPNSMMRISRAYGKKSDIENAIAWMRKSVDAGFGTPAPVLSDPDSAEVRKDPRFAAILEKMQANTQPCEHSKEFRAFDFWVGEWEVEAVGQRGKSESSIQKLVGGCMIQENWYAGGRNGGPGTTGKSMNVYNPSTHKWKQIWVDETGAVTEYYGEIRDGAMHYESDALRGQPTLKARMTFTPMPGGKVRQFIEQSADGGKTWTTSFDGMYSPK